MAVQDGVVTGIWWDMNSCQYPLHMIHSLPLPITSHLLSRFGIPSPESLSSATAYVCDSKVNPESALSIKNDGFNLSKLTSGEIQNLDKMLLTDLMLWAMDNFPVANIVLLTGNIDSFAYTLTKLHQRKFRIFVCNNNINQTSVPDYCHSYLLWPHFLLSLLQYTDNYTSLVFSNSPEGLAISYIPKSNDNPGVHMAFPAQKEKSCDDRFKVKASSEEFNKFMHQMLADGYFTEGLPLSSLVNLFGERSGGLLLDHKHLGFNKLSSLVSSLPFVCIKSKSGEKSGPVFVFPSEQGLQYCSEGCASKPNSNVTSSAKWGLIETITSLWEELINQLEHDEVPKVESGETRRI